MALVCWAQPANAATFSNTTPIVVPAADTGATSGAPAAPYPSIITVAGIPANEVISGLAVTLLDFSHEFPDDVDIVLVGPNGARVLLMSDAGASLGVTEIDLTFDDAAGPLPDATAIVPGTYRPTNYGTPDPFPAPVPAAPHGSALAGFVDTRPNGDWKLFVVDDAEFDVGTIASGWVLNFTTVATQCGNGVVETGEDCDDSNLVPGDGCGPTCLFEVCGNGFVDPGEECDDGNTISADGCSAVCVVEFCGDGIAQAGIGETCDDGNTMAGDGCGPTCLFEVCGNGFVDPGEDCDDGNTVDCDGCDACALVGSPFCNPTPIIIPAPPSTGDGAGAPSDPYPSVITVAGFPDQHVVSAVTVTLMGLSHTLPDDVDVLLVGPDGTNDLLMSDAGGDADVVSVNLTFADGAGQLPDNTILASGTYAPTNHGTPDAFPAPAPAPPYGSTLSAFVGSSPNGTWSLYIVDDSGNFETGGIDFGWTLNLTTAFAECGNGTVEPGEGCDDGNLLAGDGCSPLCNPEVCGNGVVDPGEDCDDGNMVACDGCSECRIEAAAVCGNSVTECGEVCDDANANETDGCLADCTQGAAIPPAPPECPAPLIQTVSSSGSPQPINPVGTPTTTSTINVSGLDGFVWDVNVTTHITHTACGDLDITVTSPFGTSVTLTTDNGSAFNDVFNGTTWDDWSDYWYNQALSGSLKFATDSVYQDAVAADFLAPEEPLSAFNGEDPNGLWTLTVSDDSNGNGGDLQGWSLQISTLAEASAVVGTVSGASAPNLPIGPGILTTKDTITITGAAGSVGKVAVFTNITHTLSADLDVFLTSPSGTTVTLTTDNGGPNDDAFADTTWDDDADPGNPAPYSTPNSASNLVTDTAYVNLVPELNLTPEEPLAVFNGENPNGTWTLTIRDDASSNGGTLNSWSVTINTSSCEPQELCHLVFEEGDPCSDRQAQDCVGGDADYYCGPSVVTFLQPDNRVEVTRCECYYRKSLDCDQAVGLGDSSIRCGFGTCAIGVCSILENGQPLSTLDLPIASMVPGAEYRCGCAELRGDVDDDGDVDMKDFSYILNCFERVPIPPGCENADMDGDGDVDLVDFHIVVQNQTGPHAP